MWAKAYRLRAFVLLLAVPGPLSAQEKKEEPKDPVVVIPFQETDVGLHTCAAIACVASMPPPGEAYPWGVIGVRLLASKENVPLERWQFVFTEALPLPQDLLDATVDGRPLPKVLYADYKKLKGFYPLLCRAVERTHESTLDMFKASAEENKHVTYADLKATPGRYRGKVITVKGTLKNIRKVDTFRLVADDIRTVMPHVYTGWVLGPTKNAPPFTIVFTDLPAEIAEESENLDIPVTFQGYFLAFINYPPDPAVKQRGMISPYLVGKTLVVQPLEKKDAGVAPPGDDEDKTPVSKVLIAYTVGGIVAVALFVGLLNVWLRRGDRKIQSQLANMRDRHQPFNLEPADESPEPNAAVPDMEHGIQSDEPKPPPA